MRDIVLVVHNVRSCHNVGSLLRTADGLGVQEVYLTGYTPYPYQANDDPRLPHLARKIDAQIHKTALGAEHSIPWQHAENIQDVFGALHAAGFTIVALEQYEHSIQLPDYKPPKKVAVLVGREIEGIEPEILDACDVIVEIPMYGQKESFNVSAAAAMALYQIAFCPLGE